MRCIPTHVRMSPTDPELAQAWCALLDRLRTERLADGSDPLQENHGAEWRYMFSMPFRADDGAIIYGHVFHHGSHPATGAALTRGIPAPKWWPNADSTVLSPPKSEQRASLRLVS